MLCSIKVFFEAFSTIITLGQKIIVHLIDIWTIQIFFNVFVKSFFEQIFTHNFNNYQSDNKKPSKMSETLIRYTQIPLFIFGQCVSQFLNYFIVSDILFNLGTVALLLSVCLQIWAMIHKKTKRYLIETQIKCSINYVLTAITIYLNYEYIAVCPSEIYQQGLVSTIVGMCRLSFQTFAYSLLLLPKTPKDDLFIYFATIIYWVCANAYNTIQLAKRNNSQPYENQQKDIGICLLGLITSNGALMMDLYIRSWEKQQYKNTISPEIQMEILR